LKKAPQKRKNRKTPSWTKKKTSKPIIVKRRSHKGKKRKKLSSRRKKITSERRIWGKKRNFLNRWNLRRKKRGSKEGEDLAVKAG